jgi:uncharacterized membrane protein
MQKSVLLAGESWVSSSTHVKGFDFFSSTYYATGSDCLIEALARQGVHVTHLPSHEAATKFPFELGELQRFGAVILSDIGANTLLLPPQTFLEGKRMPNRLNLIKDYVLQGGGLVMAGGYLSFQGIYGAARYRRTPVEESLPVSIQPFDDRVERPEGVVPTVTSQDHFITRGLGESWPFLLGFNEVTPKPEGEVLANVDEHPLLVVGRHGQGRAVAWTSDIGPHWCPKEFVEWPGYEELWTRLVRWVTGEGP